MMKTVWRKKYNFDLDQDDFILIEKLFIKNKNQDLMKSFFEGEFQESDKIKELNNKILKFVSYINKDFKKKHDIDSIVGNWGFRNEKGRKVSPEGHTHVRDMIYLTSITTLIGEGCWYEVDGKRIYSEEGDTILFAEEYLIEQNPNSNLKPALHGSPRSNNKRLIFLCSILPISHTNK